MSLATQPKKVALLIPSTSKGRPEWSNIKDTYLYNYTLKTFLTTQDKEHEYVFYIGIDDDDRIYANETEQAQIERFSLVFKNVSFQFISMDGIQKGHLTAMWNRLFEKAYEDECDYFYQTGDDILFKTSGWVNDCIYTLEENNNIGLTGPINNNARILTQAMVSRKHMEIFGWFFPEEIQNWCCDDWYNWVYQPNYFYPLKQHFCSNEGGQPRYTINNDRNFQRNMKTYQRKTMNLRRETFEMATRHKKLIEYYINKNSE